MLPNMILLRKTVIYLQPNSNIISLKSLWFIPSAFILLLSRLARFKLFTTFWSNLQYLLVIFAFCEQSLPIQLTIMKTFELLI